MSRSLEHELASQAQCLRGLARALVGEDDAGDLVQQTALQALQTPGEPSAPRAWLATVMRRLAGKHRRAQRRRRRREHAATADFVDRDGGPTPVEAAARRETLLRLTTALVALAEPYRGALMARYFEGLAPTAIAGRDGVPVATVKTRLQRGLALLRERLERDGDGRDWRAALVGAYGLRPASPAAMASLAVGILSMGTGVKLALGGVAAALFVVAGVWWAGGGGPPAAPFASASDRDVAPVGSAFEQPAIDRRLAEPSVVPPAPPAPEVAIVHGRCVDASGTPLAGCAVRVTAVPGGVGRELRWQQRHGAFSWQEPATITTDEGGTFRIEVPPTGPRAAELVVAAEGRLAPVWRWAQLRAGDVRDVGEVVVRRLVRVELRVENRLAQPLPWFTLRFRLDEGRRDDAIRRVERVAHTGLDGIAIVTLAEGEQTADVMCVRPDHAVSSLSVLRVPGDRPVHSTTLTIDALPNVVSISGLVVDGSGSPIVGARVKATMAEARRGTSWTPFVTATDVEGRFVLARPAVETWAGDLLLHVVGDGYDQAEPVLVGWGKRDVQIVLATAIALEVVVRDPTGAPVTDYDLTLDQTSHPSTSRPEKRFEPGPHPEGVVVCDGLPRGDYQLTIEPRSPLLCAWYAKPLTINGRDAGVVQVALATAAARVLRVQAANGEPVAGAQFERLANRQRHAEASPDTQSLALTFQQSLRSAGNNQVLCFQSGETDAQGAAVLRGPADEAFAVRVRGVGNLPVVVVGVDLAERDPLVVTVQRGASVRGRIGPVSFGRWAGEFLAASEEATLRLSLRHSASPRSASAAVAADGTFAAEALIAGTWTVSLKTRTSNDSRIDWDLGSVLVGEGATVDRDFDLAAAVPVRLRGTLRIDGAPAEGGLSITDPAKSQEVRASLGPDGMFDVWVRPDALRIDYWRGSDLRLCVTDRFDVLAGADVAPSFDITTGQLRLLVADGESNGVPGVRMRWRDDSTSRSGAALSDTEGSITRRVEAGTFRLQCLPRSLQDEAALGTFQREHRDDPDALERRYLELGVIHVLPGDERTHTIVLPPGYAR